MIDLVDAFISQVLSHPTLPAVEHNGVSTSYEELSAFAFRIAGSIRQVASTPSPRVLLALSHSTSAYAGMIGTLIAGGTFCPVNIDGPESRNAIITRTFSPDIILIEGSPSSFLDDSSATTPRIDLSLPGTHLLDGPCTEYSEIAYVAFTSGSSGEPKGVKIGRGAFSHFLSIAGAYFDLIPGERWGQFTNLNHDLAVMDVFLAVTRGGALVPLTSPKERLMPAKAIKEKRIAIWQSVPGVLDLMISANHVSSDHLAPLRLMSFCGDKLLPAHLNLLFSARPHLQVFNTYGATETTGFNTINRLTSDNYLDSCNSATVALGDDVPGWTISLLGGSSADEGEIVVSGDCLGLGYWRDEDRTRNAFRQLRPAGGQERRSYFTGDWGIRKNSRLYFSCRKDRQVKILGERIELDEIDYLLRKAGFADAYTIVVGDVLHSFVESVDDVDQDRVRAHLSKSLSFQSVPKTIRPLQSLPRNPNGKIDREALERSIT
jgi:D-alanine--poly(phosphoribitol) ligase subunit 1